MLLLSSACILSHLVLLFVLCSRHVTPFLQQQRASIQGDRKTVRLLESLADTRTRCSCGAYRHTGKSNSSGVLCRNLESVYCIPCRYLH